MVNSAHGMRRRRDVRASAAQPIELRLPLGVVRFTQNATVEEVYCAGCRAWLALIDDQGMQDFYGHHGSGCERVPDEEAPPPIAHQIARHEPKWDTGAAVLQTGADEYRLEVNNAALNGDDHPRLTRDGLLALYRAIGRALAAHGEIATPDPGDAPIATLLLSHQLAHLLGHKGGGRLDTRNVRVTVEDPSGQLRHSMLGNLYAIESSSDRANVWAQVYLGPLRPPADRLALSGEAA